MAVRPFPGSEGSRRVHEQRSGLQLLRLTFLRATVRMSIDSMVPYGVRFRIRKGDRRKWQRSIRSHPWMISPTTIA